MQVFNDFNAILIFHDDILTVRHDREVSGAGGEARRYGGQVG